MAFGDGALGTTTILVTQEGELCPQARNTREEPAPGGAARQSLDPRPEPSWALDTGAPSLVPVLGLQTQGTAQQSCG